MFLYTSTHLQKELSLHDLYEFLRKDLKRAFYEHDTFYLTKVHDFIFELRVDRSS